MSSEDNEAAGVFSKMEFAVQMSCSSCSKEVSSKLSSVEGVRSVYVDVPNEMVLVETSLSSTVVQSLLEETGRLVVFRGFGGTGSDETTHLGAAVVALRGRECEGVGLVRMVQLSEEVCLIEATIDGLSPAKHEVKIHEYGDMSEGGISCGDVLVGGELGVVSPDDTGRGTLHTTSQHLKVYNLIGRSVVVHQSNKRVLCGVIARSAGLFQNTKKLCTCDGVTIWDEARRAKTVNS